MSAGIDVNEQEVIIIKQSPEYYKLRKNLTMLTPPPPPPRPLTPRETYEAVQTQWILFTCLDFEKVYRLPLVKDT